MKNSARVSLSKFSEWETRQPALVPSPPLFPPTAQNACSSVGNGGIRNASCRKVGQQPDVAQPDANPGAGMTATSQTSTHSLAPTTSSRFETPAPLRAGRCSDSISSMPREQRNATVKQDIQRLEAELASTRTELEKLEQEEQQASGDLL
jgi:hypothetical protein